MGIQKLRVLDLRARSRLVERTPPPTIPNRSFGHPRPVFWTLPDPSFGHPLRPVFWTQTTALLGTLDLSFRHPRPIEGAPSIVTCIGSQNAFFYGIKKCSNRLRSSLQNILTLEILGAPLFSLCVTSGRKDHWHALDTDNYIENDTEHSIKTDVEDDTEKQSSTRCLTAPRCV